MACRWISNESPAVFPDLIAARPDGPARFLLALDGQPVAWTDPHGQSLDWLA